MKKFYKIYYSWNKRKYVPLIQLKGNWLEKLGFKIGDIVEIECDDNIITIKKSSKLSSWNKNY